MRFVAVFDTNVLLSAVGWRGKRFQCLELARARTIEAVICPEILNELAEKLDVRLRLPPDAVTATLADLLTVLGVIQIPNELRVIDSDPDDDKVLECAIMAQATHIVSGNRRHLLPLGDFRGISIVSPAEFLRLVTTDTGSAIT